MRPETLSSEMKRTAIGYGTNGFASALRWAVWLAVPLLASYTVSGAQTPAVARQTPDRSPLASPQVEYLEDPKPYSFQGFRGTVGRQVDLHSELTARVVSTRPLVLDVLDAAGPSEWFLILPADSW